MLFFEGLVLQTILQKKIDKVRTVGYNKSNSKKERLKIMKKVLTIFLALALSVSMLIPAYAEEAPISLTVNGATVECDVPPQIVEDRTLVPLRAAFEALGAKILLWDESTSTVHAESPDGDVISLQIGSKNLFKAGEVTEMEVPAIIIGDRTMVPMRTIAESIGCNVEWIPESRTVQITK